MHYEDANNSTKIVNKFINVVDMTTYYSFVLCRQPQAEDTRDDEGEAEQAER